MTAPEKLITWFEKNAFIDRNGRLPAGLVLQYHSRSDDHSKVLGRAIVQDLLDVCPPLRAQAAAGFVAFGINHRFTWPNGKSKALDLAIGLLKNPMIALSDGQIHEVKGKSEAFARLFVACEEKAAMTEHGKSQPRIYSELNDSHTIVHQGADDTIAAGITMVNAAKTFISPLRQRPDKPVEITKHEQPRVTQSMVEHLRKLPKRSGREGVGLDAYCTFIVHLDNQGTTSLVTEPPAPQPGDSDHYQTFLADLAAAYAARFSDLDELPTAEGKDLSENLTSIAVMHPGLLRRVSTLATNSELDGAEELAAILDAVETRVNGLPVAPSE